MSKPHPTHRASTPNGTPALERGRWWGDFGGFAVAVVFPSTAIFKKVGAAPLLFYCTCAVLGLYILLRHVLPAAERLITTRMCVAAVLAAFGLLALLHHFIFPILLEQGGFQLFGIQFGVSDSNDAYVVALRALLDGHYPYYGQTFLGGQLSPMPGALLLALPLYLAHATSYQNVIWLALFWSAFIRYTRDARLASIVMLSVIAVAPGLSYMIVQANDYPANGLFVLLGGLGMIAAVQMRRPLAWSMAAAAFLGLALSSRANFLLLVPILAFGLGKHAGVRSAIMHMGLCLGVFALVTLPFLLYDPLQFAPLHTAEKVTMIGRYPYADKILFIAGLMLATLLGYRQAAAPTVETIAAQAFVIQLVAVLAGFVLASQALGRPDLMYPHFAHMGMFFGVVAFGPRLFRAALYTIAC